MAYKLFLYSFYLLFCTITLRAQDTPLPVSELMHAASEKAGRENKKVFVIAHASWCGWCKKMDRSMTDDPQIKTEFEKAYVITHITAYESKGKEALENPGALDFLKTHGGADEGLPFWFIFDPQGKLLSDSKMKYKGKEELSNSGCPASEEEVANFIQVLKKTSSMSEGALKKIQQRFRLNEQ